MATIGHGSYKTVFLADRILQEYRLVLTSYPYRRGTWAHPPPNDRLSAKGSSSPSSRSPSAVAATLRSLPWSPSQNEQGSPLSRSTGSQQSAKKYKAASMGAGLCNQSRRKPLSPDAIAHAASRMTPEAGRIENAQQLGAEGFQRGKARK